MQFDVITLFPDIIYSYISDAILGRAEKQDIISVTAYNFRRFSGNKWGHVDDKPFGGGAGMVLRVEPIYEALKSIKAKKGSKKEKIIIMDPAGKKFDQRMAVEFSKLDRLVIVSGRYEGFDARVYDLVDERVSVGDYVLAGGELPALTIIEATSRLIPGVLGNEESLKEESHNRENQKEYPQYTRPEEFMGKKVPAVLLSGDHKKIEEWRKEQSK